MEKPLEAGALVVAERAVLMNLAGAGGVGPAGEEGLMPVSYTHLGFFTF